MAAEWWDPRGKFAPLHRFNPVRLAFIRDEVRTFDAPNAAEYELVSTRLNTLARLGGDIDFEIVGRYDSRAENEDADAKVREAHSDLGARQGRTRALDESTNGIEQRGGTHPDTDGHRERREYRSGAEHDER